MEENKAKKELEARQNKLYDDQRIAINEQVNRNHRKFVEENFAVARDTLNNNL